MSASAVNTTARNQHRIQNNNNHQERKASNAEIQRLVAQLNTANGGGNLHEPRELELPQGDGQFSLTPPQPPSL